MTSSAPLLAGSALGYFDNTASLVSSLLGQPADNTSVLVRYTLVGDSTLDQMVDIRDLYQLASNWQQKDRGWGGGDYDYNIITDAFDLGLLSSKWQQNIPPPAPAVSIGLRSPARRTAARGTDLMP
jgi:hypothetical protein